MTNIVSGVDKAWGILSCLGPDDVCGRAGAGVEYKNGIYHLKSFGRVFSVDTGKKEILSLSAGGDVFLGKFVYFFKVSALWYLIKAADTMPSGKLLKPSGITGGDIFFRGSHILPLDAVAAKYAKNRDGFIARGITLGGKEVDYGDAALELHPLPKIPVTLILWLEDMEWGPRVDLLFDSTASSHLPLDILWSVAMMSALVFL